MFIRLYSICFKYLSSFFSSSQSIIQIKTGILYFDFIFLGTISDALFFEENKKDSYCHMH